MWTLLILLFLQQSTSVTKMIDEDTCSDEYPDCWFRRAECKGEDPLQVLEMLVDCRRTCGQVFYREEASSSTVLMLGGLEDNITDVLGLHQPLCTLSQGIDRVARRSLLLHRVATLEQPGWVPRFTEEGWFVDELEPRLLGMLNVARMQILKQRGEEEEPCNAEVAPFNCQQLIQDRRECRVDNAGRTKLLPLGQVLRDTLAEALHPIAERWARVPLLSSSVYGIRRYRHGAWLATHTDRLSTHVISAIVHLGHKGSDWPLYIGHLGGKTNKIFLEQGQVLWYESALLPHGRPEPFQGESYDNVFVHFKPSDRNWYRDGEGRWDKGEKPKSKVALKKDKDTMNKVDMMGLKRHEHQEMVKMERVRPT